MSDCAFEKDIIVNEAFCDAVIDDPELEIVIRNLIITAIEMYTAQFYEEPDNPENFHENTKDFTKKILVRYFDMLCRLRNEQERPNEMLNIIDMVNPIQGEC